jgi:RNA polymerase-binding transcription factor DksA
MPDAMDRVQAFNDAHVEDALARRAHQPARAGRTHCANLDCGEPITELRRGAGAQLCLECLQEEERQQAKYRKGAW